MKTQRSLTAVSATLVVLVLSLSITFTATSSSRGAVHDSLRTVWLTVKIVDDKGEKVTGAQVVIFQGERQLGRRVSDDSGRAQLEIVVNTDRAVELKIEVSATGMETNPHVLKLGTNFPTRPPLEEIELKPGVSRSEVVVTVKVVDSEGKDVRGALVNVYKGSLDSSLFASPSVAQDTTGANGSVTFKLPLRAGEIPDIRLAVSKEDMKDQRRSLNLQANFPTELPTERFVLMPRTASGDGLPTANIRVNVEDEQGNNLEGALVALTSGGQEPSQRYTPHERSTGPDGYATVGIELMSGLDVESIGITVSKPGYKVFKKVERVNNKWGKAVGTTIEITPISLERLPVAAFEVKVTVLEGDTNIGVPDAEVILDGPDYAKSTTDSQGVATLPVDKPGSYTVRISQDNYRSLSDGQVHVLPDKNKPTVPDPFRLRLKHTRDAAGDTIAVTVLAKDFADSKDKPHPLRNAAVSDGRHTVYTNETGQVTLEGAYYGSQEVTVTLPNYETRTQRVPISRFLPLSKATGKATFVLTPILSDITPLHLIVKVVDELEKPVPDAGVEFFSHTGRSLFPMTPTHKDGKNEFVSSLTEVPLDELRKGISINIEIDRKQVVVNRALPDSMLKPSLDAQEFLVQVDGSALRRAIDALEAKVFAWKDDYGGKAASEVDAFRIKAQAAVAQAQALLTALEAEQEAFGIGVGPGVSHCSKAATPQLNIRKAEAEARLKAKEAERLISEALTLSKICSAANDVALIRSNLKKANQLLVDIGRLKANAAKDHESLLSLSNESMALRTRVHEAQMTLATIERLGEVVDQNVRNARPDFGHIPDPSKTLIGRQITLKAELAVLAVKADGEPELPGDLRKRIDAMDGILRSTANDVSYGTQKSDDDSFALAVDDMNRIRADAARVIPRLTNAACPIATLDEAIEAIKTAFKTASLVLDVAIASDVPQLADACAAKIRTKPGSTAGSTATETTEDKIDENITNPNDPDKQNTQDTSPGGFWEAAKAGKKDVENKITKKPSSVEEDPGKSNKPNPQDTSSGGFWDAAKAGKKKVDNAVSNKPATSSKPSTADRENSADESRTNATNKTTSKTTKPSTSVEEIPEDNSPRIVTNKTTNKTNSPPLTVEAIPESYVDNPPLSNRPPKSATNPPVVEEIPENKSDKVASNKPSTKTTNKPPVVEEIPETANTNVASNRPRVNSPQVEEIPETDNRPATTGNQPNSSGTSGNSQANEKPKKEKKPRDPNKPSIWTLLGAATREAITGQQNPGVTNNPGNNPNPGDRGGTQNFNLAGTWSVTTQSTGDAEMQQNWTRTNVWQISNLGGGRWQVRQEINGKSYDETYSTVDDGGGRFRFIGSNPDGSTYEMSGTWNQTQFSIGTSGGQNRITINGTRQ